MLAYAGEALVEARRLGGEVEGVEAARRQTARLAAALDRLAEGLGDAAGPAGDLLAGVRSQVQRLRRTLAEQAEALDEAQRRG
jgi:hypothetical protein